MMDAAFLGALGVVRMQSRHESITGAVDKL